MIYISEASIGTPYRFQLNPFNVFSVLEAIKGENLARIRKNQSPQKLIVLWLYVFAMISRDPQKTNHYLSDFNLIKIDRWSKFQSYRYGSSSWSAF